MKRFPLALGVSPANCATPGPFASATRGYISKHQSGGTPWANDKKCFGVCLSYFC
jgi:hypothetical protein